MQIFLVLWYICTFVQTLLGFGSAYRFTKNGGDNGVILFLMLLVMCLVALIPGLGFYIWGKSLESEDDSGNYNSNYSSNYNYSSKRPSWMPPKKDPDFPSRHKDDKWSNPYK